LQLAPSSYFDDIERSDIMCDGKAGYMLEVDAVTGGIIRYNPGINCVVC